MRKLILTQVLFQLLCFSATRADFLAGARGAGIGFPYFVQANNPSGALYNPSDHSFAGGWQSLLTYQDLRNNDEYSSWPENTSSGQFAVAYHEPGFSAIALKTPEPPEIFNPPPDSEIKPPVIDKDTDFRDRQYQKYEVELDVSDISSKGFTRIVFYLRPKQIIKTNGWKLYVFKAKIKNWSSAEIDNWALKVIEGSGLPPINVVWDGKSRDGRLLPTGKYYCILTAEDTEGQHYATKWHKFKLK